MRILVTGAAGMIGRKLTGRIAAEGGLGGRPVEHATLADVVLAPATPGLACTPVVADVATHGQAELLVSERPNVIFHLAAVLSGEAEADFA